MNGVADVDVDAHVVDAHDHGHIGTQRRRRRLHCGQWRGAPVDASGGGVRAEAVIPQRGQLASIALDCPWLKN